jgi:preprotein translocase subunit SecA
MQRLGMEEGVPIEHGMVSKAIERAQKQVEAQNFSVRKHLLEYDDVMNKQRENIYALRRQILDGQIKFEDEDGGEEIVGTREYVMELAEDVLDNLRETYAGREADYEAWDLDALKRETSNAFAVDTDDLDFSDRTSDEIRDLLWQRVLKSYEEKEAIVPAEVLRRVERDVMLQIADTQWKDHLYSLDHLKEGIGLRGYGQRDPLVEYKKESFELFQDMKTRIDEETVKLLWRLRPILDDGQGGVPPPTARRAPTRQRSPLILSGPSEEPVSAFAGATRSAVATPVAPPPSNRQPPRVGGDDAVVKTVRRDEPKVGRNDPCPCGSGKKYKKCHGQGT